MNVEGITRSQIASHLQKYRKHMRRFKVNVTKADISKKAMKSNFESSSNINPQCSYNYLGLTKENLFKSQIGDTLGQSSLLLNNNDSIHSMYDGSIYGLNEPESNLSPMRESVGFSRGVLPLNEESECAFETSQMSQVPRRGQYGTPSDISVDSNGNGHLGESLGAMNWNLNKNDVRNYESSTSRFSSPFSSFLHNKVQPHHNLISQTDGLLPTSILDTSQVPSFGQYGIPNDVVGMEPEFGTSYMHSNYNGINTDQVGNLVGLGRERVNVNGNVSLGQNLGSMNWNFDENNMSNHGSSTSRFSSPFSSFEDQSLSHLNEETNELVPGLENLSLYNDHQSINPFLGNTINSHFVENQDQGLVNNENLEFANDDQLERNEILTTYSVEDINNLSINNVKLNSNGETLNSTAANLEMLFPTLDMNIVNQHQGQVLSGGNLEFANDNQLERNAILAGYSIEDINNLNINNHQGQVLSGVNLEFANDNQFERNAILAGYSIEDINNLSINNVNDNSNEETLNSIAANNEMNFTILDVNTINQVNGNSNEETLNSIVANSEMNFTTLDVNTINQVDDNSNEETLNSIAANSEMNFTTLDVNIINEEEQGAVDMMDIVITFDEEEEDVAAFTDIPEQDVEILTDVPEQGVTDLTDVPLTFDQDWKDDGLMNFMLDVDDMF
ncbi:hypothetical protein ISN44_As05g057440 [Arabidopsis suecica]|uniref:Uncharacterized protein n=1 Tax=Arabidopsis suecica TaxID=45249 RepID=A0A8T2E2G6_ARASU|nr:hypothetical protein ISN44_As05g057440 [Arabidopsis suecica]